MMVLVTLVVGRCAGSALISRSSQTRTMMIIGSIAYQKKSKEMMMREDKIYREEALAIS